MSRAAPGLAAGLLAGLLAGPAAAQAPGYTNVHYTCDRGAPVSVTYVEAEDLSIAVLWVEGRQMVLEREVSGSGARYGWPSDGSHYVWWDHGDEAMLLWSDGETGDETPVYATCALR